MKKPYEAPDWEMIRIVLSDIIADSTLGEGGGQAGDPGDPGGGGFGGEG